MGVEDCFYRMRPRTGTLQCVSQIGKIYEINYSNFLNCIKPVESSWNFLRNFIKNREMARIESLYHARIRHYISEPSELRSINQLKSRNSKPVFRTDNNVILPRAVSSKNQYESHHILCPSPKISENSNCIKIKKIHKIRVFLTSSCRTSTSKRSIKPRIIKLTEMKNSYFTDRSQTQNNTRNSSLNRRTFFLTAQRWHAKKSSIGTDDTDNQLQLNAKIKHPL